MSVQITKQKKWKNMVAVLSLEYEANLYDGNSEGNILISIHVDDGAQERE